MDVYKHESYSIPGYAEADAAYRDALETWSGEKHGAVPEAARRAWAYLESWRQCCERFGAHSKPAAAALYYLSEWLAPIEPQRGLGVRVALIKAERAVCGVVSSDMSGTLANLALVPELAVEACEASARLALSIDRLLNEEPDGETECNVGLALYERRAPYRAVPWLERAVALLQSPERSAEARWVLASAYAMVGQIERADKVFVDALARLRELGHEDLAWALYLHAKLLLGLGRDEDARQVLEEAAALEAANAQNGSALALLAKLVEDPESVERRLSPGWLSGAFDRALDAGTFAEAEALLWDGVEAGLGDGVPVECVPFRRLSLRILSTPPTAETVDGFLDELLQGLAGLGYVAPGEELFRAMDWEPEGDWSEPREIYWKELSIPELIDVVLGIAMVHPNRTLAEALGMLVEEAAGSKAESIALRTMGVVEELLHTLNDAGDSSEAMARYQGLVTRAEMPDEMTRLFIEAFEDVHPQIRVDFELIEPGKYAVSLDVHNEQGDFRQGVRHERVFSNIDDDRFLAMVRGSAKGFSSVLQNLRAEDDIGSMVYHELIIEHALVDKSLCTEGDFTNELDTTAKRERWLIKEFFHDARKKGFDIEDFSENEEAFLVLGGFELSFALPPIKDLGQAIRALMTKRKNWPFLRSLVKEWAGSSEWSQDFAWEGGPLVCEVLAYGTYKLMEKEVDLSDAPQWWEEFDAAVGPCMYVTHQDLIRGQFFG